jgi:NAD(P)-dependent dehydrogenase (short-subunit alcohol dehydrogenase family)
MRLENKVAIITGGSQGIGKEYALRYAREGADVAIADVREDQAKEVVREIERLGRKALAIEMDVSKEAETQAAAAEVAERFGKIDILVNNAALYFDMDMTDKSLAYFNKVLSVNLTGVWLMTRAVSRYMKRQRSGKVINQSSTAAYLSNLGWVDTTNPDEDPPPFSYSVAKAGVNGLTKYFAGNLGPWGINVNAICPGVTMTEATKSKVPEEMVGMLTMATALRKTLQPEDLCGTALFLASSDSDLMTGQVLVVDAGMFMLG